METFEPEYHSSDIIIQIMLLTWHCGYISSLFYYFSYQMFAEIFAKCPQNAAVYQKKKSIKLEPRNQTNI